MNRIYLDHNATSPLRPSVAEGMAELISRNQHGNPSSLHEDGRKSRRILEEARDQVAAALKVDSAEIFFTSGGTESNNLAITGLVADSSLISTCVTEHPSILEPVKHLHEKGRTGRLIPVDHQGRVVLDQVPQKGLVSVHWFNNETGIAQDLNSIAEIVHQDGGRLHSDGSQGFFRVPMDLGNSPLDSATLTAHKAGGPTGVGALWIRKGFLHRPFSHGGPQEKKIRPGTENLLAIHGMGLLAAEFRETPSWDLEGLQELRTVFLDSIEDLENHRVVAQTEDDWPGCINIAFGGIHAETLLVRLDMEGISASSGSACSSGAREPSHVLKAMEIPESSIRGSVRFSFGPETQQQDVLRTGEILRRTVRDLRSHSAGTPPVL